MLLIRARNRESDEAEMARFLHGLNDEISDFVEMFPYNTLQDILEQAKRTERRAAGHLRDGDLSKNRLLLPSPAQRCAEPQQTFWGAIFKCIFLQGKESLPPKLTFSLFNPLPPQSTFFPPRK